MPSECSILMRAAPVYERLRKRKLRPSAPILCVVWIHVFSFLCL